MSRRLLIIIALLAAVFAILTGVAIRTGVLAPRDQTAAIGGPFQLVDQTGRSVDQTALRGKWSAVFFGYTYCPDACPTTLFALGQAEKLLGQKAGDFQTVFVTVDPARDTPKQMAAYLSNEAFPRRVLGLTGSPEQVAKAAKAYHVFYQRGAGSDEAYAMDHSTITYLMNPKGRFACVIPYGATPDEIARKVEAGMRNGAGAESC